MAGCSAGACLEAMRPLNSAMMGLAVVVGAFIAGGGRGLEPLDLVLAALTGFFYTAVSMLDNDIVDLEVDRVNAPWRPLPSGRLSVGCARLCIAILTLAGLASSLAIGPLAALLALLALGLALAYNHWGKRTGLPGNAMVAFIVAFPILFGSIVSLGGLNPAGLVYAGIVFLAALGREVAKGIVDVEGDRRAGVRTVAVVRGPRAAARLAVGFYTAAVALSLVVPYATGASPLLYYAAVAPVDLVFIVESWRLLREPTRENALRHKKAVLLAMLAGLLAFFISAYTSAGPV